MDNDPGLMVVIGTIVVAVLFSLGLGVVLAYEIDALEKRVDTLEQR